MASFNCWIIDGIATFDDLVLFANKLSLIGYKQENSFIINTLKDITDVAATKPYLIDYLRTQQINGSDYLEQLENEKERPLLMLQVA